MGGQMGGQKEWRFRRRFRGETRWPVWVPHRRKTYRLDRRKVFPENNLRLHGRNQPTNSAEEAGMKEGLTAIIAGRSFTPMPDGGPLISARVISVRAYIPITSATIRQTAWNSAAAATLCLNRARIPAPSISSPTHCWRSAVSLQGPK